MIVNNPEVLSEKYLPEKLLHRDKERSEIVTAIKNDVSTLVYGPAGSGKTSVVKACLKSLNKNYLASYIDCTIYLTTYSILKEVIPRAKLIMCRSNYELMKELMREAKEKRIVVCLDNFESIKEKELIRKFLLIGLTVIAITDKEENIHLLSDDVRARMNMIKFNPYTPEELLSILKNRAEKALEKWSYDEGILKRIVEKSNGSASLAINSLKLAAINAEKRRSRRIEEKDIPKNNPGSPLKRDERVLLEILKNHGNLPAGVLYQLYRHSVSFPRCERAFRNYMQSLASKGLVRAMGDKKGRMYEVVESVEGDA
jgi:Cdc6-like AAA superfamily ATPase